MFRRPWLWVVPGTLLGCWLGWAASRSGGEEAQPESLQVRFAQAQVRLAEITLQKAQRMNQRVAGAVAAVDVVEYREDVEVAKAQLAAARAGAGENQFLTWLRSAQAADKAAQSRLRSSRAANARLPGTIDDLEIERLRLRAELARLRLARGQALRDRPPVEQLQWQVNLLRDEVQRLSEQVSRQPPAGRLFPLWWFW
jgi:hypothetical protein